MHANVWRAMQDAAILSAIFTVLIDHQIPSEKIGVQRQYMNSRDQSILLNLFSF